MHRRQSEDECPEVAADRPDSEVQEDSQVGHTGKGLARDIRAPSVDPSLWLTGQESTASVPFQIMLSTLMNLNLPLVKIGCSEHTGDGCSDGDLSARPLN